MRGKILQYNGDDGSGIVVVDGQQHKFTLAAWKGDVAPACWEDGRCRSR